MTTTLTAATAAMDRGIAVAQKIRETSAAPEADTAARDLQSAIEEVTRALQESDQEMKLMMKSEGSRKVESGKWKVESKN